MRRTLVALLVLGSLGLTSGCGILVALGVGGTAGYMIRKGEDGGGSAGKTSTTSKSGAASKGTAESKPQSASKPPAASATPGSTTTAD